MYQTDLIMTARGLMEEAKLIQKQIDRLENTPLYNKREKARRDIIMRVREIGDQLQDIPFRAASFNSIVSALEACEQYFTHDSWKTTKGIPQDCFGWLTQLRSSLNDFVHDMRWQRRDRQKNNKEEKYG